MKLSSSIKKAALGVLLFSALFVAFAQISPASAFIRGGYSVVVSGGFPGQAGFPVGFAATPSVAPPEFAAANGQTWPGAFSSLTAWPNGTGSQTVSSGTFATSGAGTSGNPWVFAFYDFNAGSGKTTITVSNAIFVGCRFQSNDQSDANVQLSGANVTFIYSSMVPTFSLAPTVPNGAWPAAGAGQQITLASGTYATFAIPSTSGYQYGIRFQNLGALQAVYYGDIWGFDNGVDINADGGTGPYIVQKTWIHDARNQNQSGGHSDGVGYLNGHAQPSNINVSGNTIALIGNTNLIGMQGGTGTVCNSTFNGNYLTGDERSVFLTGMGSCSNSFTNNIFATDLPWVINPLQQDYSSTYTMANTNPWRNNTLLVISGTSPVSGSNFAWTNGMNGFFIYPSAGNSTPVLPQSTDWPN